MKLKIQRDLILIIVFLSILPVISGAEHQRPEFNNGLAAKWHYGRMCVTCHDMLLGQEESSNIKCLDCHSRIKKGIISEEVAELHQEKVCIRCHVGTKENVYNVTAQDFHRVMSRVQCTKCHVVKNGEYLRPNKTLCSDCHAGGPHVVHGNKLTDMCRRCHGEFGEQFADDTANINIQLTTYSASYSPLKPFLEREGVINTTSVGQQEASGSNTIGGIITDILIKIVNVFRG